jgi:dTDP-4-dehydrorhamnose 3,5-epimerase
MNVKDCLLADVKIIAPAVFGDERGLFIESFSKSKFQKLGLPGDFEQDNQSFSKKGVLRGLHFQTGEHAQGKLVRVISGRVLDVAVDMRKDSPTFGKWEFFDLNGLDNEMVYIPEGFAHGFLALEDSVFSYKCTKGYNKASESGIIWNDSALAIQWPEMDYIISEKDQELLQFNQINCF